MHLFHIAFFKYCIDLFRLLYNLKLHGDKAPVALETRENVNGVCASDWYIGGEAKSFQVSAPAVFSLGCFVSQLHIWFCA